MAALPDSPLISVDVEFVDGLLVEGNGGDW